MAERVKRRKLSPDGVFEASSVSAGVVPEEATATEKKDQRRSLFVRSLPASVTTEQLTEHFSQSYPLKHATVVFDSKTKASKGYGFVTFADPDDAQAAAAELNNSVLDGRKIKVEVAESRHREKDELGGQKPILSKGAQVRAEREKKQADAQAPRLIVRNLPWSIKEPADLELLFRSYGKIKQAIVPKRSPKVQAGFGFVLIRGRRNAEKALAGVNGKLVDGRTLAVDWAVDKETWKTLQNDEQVNSGAAEDTNAQAIQGKNGSTIEEDDIVDPDGLHEGDDSGNIDEDESMDGVAVDAEQEDEDEEELEDALDEDEAKEDEPEEEDEEMDSNDTTVFIRNLPFTCTDEILQEHFSKLGAVRYARVVFDHETERSKGTGFVCFFNSDDAKSCVKDAPKHQPPAATATGDKKRRGEAMMHSVLQNEASYPTGQYTLDGRVLQISRAVSKSEASRREAEGSSKRDVRDRDKRRLYLLSEGTIPRGSKLYEKLSPTEINIREASAKQRQKLIKTNPTLHLSLTRLSVRNIPRTVTSKELKALAREAIVGFATDVKGGLRQPLSKEELNRVAEEMKEAEKLRKLKGTGIVKQATIVFEGREGAKIPEKSGAGRSRGYGFIEYYTHRNALMGLRWLNGHAVRPNGGEAGDRSKRLIVEFAIENAQVVGRRREREAKERLERPEPRRFKPKPGMSDKEKVNGFKPKAEARSSDKKRKREDKPEKWEKKQEKVEAPKKADPISQDEKNKLAMRNRIIGRKRNMRKSRKG